MKRPFEVVVSFLRATNAEVTPNRDLFWQLQEMGYRMFNWGPPTGHPEESAAWLSTNGMLRRWNIINYLQSTWLKAATFDLPGQTPPGLTARRIVEFWVGRLLAVPPPASTMNRLIDLMRQNGSADAPPTGSTDEIVDRIKSVVTLTDPASFNLSWNSWRYRSQLNQALDAFYSGDSPVQQAGRTTLTTIDCINQCAPAARLVRQSHPVYARDRRQISGRARRQSRQCSTHGRKSDMDVGLLAATVDYGG